MWTHAGERTPLADEGQWVDAVYRESSRRGRSKDLTVSVESGIEDHNRRSRRYRMSGEVHLW